MGIYGIPTSVGRLSLAIALAASSQAIASASAQTAPATPPASPADALPPSPETAPAAASANTKDTTAADIIVTGTAIRGVKPAGSATLSVDLAELKGAGLGNPIELQRIIPQLQTSNYVETSAASNSNSTKGSTFNLRGLGAAGTLVLVDGRRIVTNGTSTPYYDANSIPFVALQRVEVVTDGASAIYGADAVGGVVNFILRKNYRGATFSARVRDQLGTKTVELSGGAGTTWNLDGRKGSVFASLSYSSRDNIPRSASKFLSTNLAPLGGNDGRVVGSIVQSNAPGTLAVASTTPGQTLYFALPGTKTSGLTLADLTPGLGNVAKDADDIDYVGLEHRIRGTLVVTQELTDWLSLSSTTLFSSRQTRAYGTNFASQFVSITIAPTSPYYIAGIPNSRGNQTINQEFGGFYQRVTEKTLDTTLALEAKLGRWRAQLYGTYGSNSACGNCISDEVINQAVGTKVAAGLINPFGPFPAAIQALARGPRFDRGIQKLGNEVLKFDGPLFDLPGGTVRAAFGGEIQQQWFFYGGSSANNPNAVPLPARPAVSGSRDVQSGFGEINVPVLGPDMDIPLVHDLNINAAGRLDHYSDFGSAFSPKVGATLHLTGGLSLRGNWGKSFRAPSLQDANPGTLGNTLFQLVANGANTPAIPITNLATGQTTVLTVAGGNAGLGPERATTFSLGADYVPTFVRGFKTSLTYYSIRYRDRINTVPQATYLATPSNYALYAPFIVPLAAQPATCVSSNPATFSAQLQQYLALAPYRDSGIAGCDARAVLDIRSLNIGETTQTGLDGQIDYVTPTGFGDIGAGLRLTQILTYKESVVPGSPLISRLNQIGYPDSTRGYGYVTATVGALKSTLAVNYIGPYTNNLPITVAGALRPASRVPSWTTFDLNFSLNLPDKGWLKGTSITLSLLNVTDKDPPIVLSGTNGFDPLNANPYGRMVQIDLTKAF